MRIISLFLAKFIKLRIKIYEIKIKKKYSFKIGENVTDIDLSINAEQCVEIKVSGWENHKIWNRNPDLLCIVPNCETIGQIVSE